jgi:molybdopterin/thiamine biosynthesis adenylyltransferase
VTTIVRAGRPVEEEFLTQPDYAASALAMQPHLDRGERLLGEAHGYPGIIGPSAGDRRTLRSISTERFPDYLCVVVATFNGARDPVITAHSVKDGKVVGHTVRTAENAYLALLPPPSVRVLLVGAGSGGCLVAQQVSKLPILSLTMLDNDRFEPRNLDRHLATPSANGRSKAQYLAAYLRTRTSVRISAIRLEVSPPNKARVAALVAEHDLVINATGHPPTSILLSQICAQLNRPCIHSGVFARGSGGFVFTQTPDGPCYECLYDLQQQQATDDAATLAALTAQYGYTEAELAGHLGLWADVNIVASVHAKAVLEYLKRSTATNSFSSTTTT